MKSFKIFEWMLPINLPSLWAEITAIMQAVVHMDTDEKQLKIAVVWKIRLGLCCVVGFRRIICSVQLRMQHLLESTVQYSYTQSQWRWLCLCWLLSRCAMPSTGCAFVTCWFSIFYMIHYLVHCANDHICWTERQTGCRECWVGMTKELVEVVWTSAKKRGWLGKEICRIDQRWHTWLEMVNEDLKEIWYMHSRCTLWKQLTLRVLLEGCWHLVCWRMSVSA